MAKLRLYPPSGTLDDAKSLKFEISDVNIDSLHVNMENATHGTKISITSLQNMGDGSYMGVMDVNIPNHLTQAAISIFAHLEEKKDDGAYRTIQICPTIFTIKNEVELTTEKLSVFPSFVSPGDMCSVRFFGKPDSKKVVSINDKFFRTVVNSSGLGSINFKGSDVLGNEEIDSVYQLPIYLYSEEDNFTKKVFSNTYLNVLPSSLSMHTDHIIDPRCDPTDAENYVNPPGSWNMPIECIEPPIVILPDPIEPTMPPNALPTTCKEDNVIISDSFICKIFGHDATVLNNGTVVHAYLSPKTSISNDSDPEFNKNAVFIATHQSTLDIKVIVNRDVVIEPKSSGEIFRIHVQSDVWDSLTDADNPSVSGIYVVLFNEEIGFQRIQIIGRTIDEYTGGHILLGLLEDDIIEISNWLFCVNAVFYHASESPPLNGLDPTGANGETNIGGFGGWVRDADNDVLQILSVSIASNSKYVGEDEESYIYVVVDALQGGKSQLFFASRILKDPGFAGSTSVFTQLTTDGNNWNPVVKIGSDNNLHITWESDRAGIKQVYYGVLGLSSVSSSCTAFSSCLDKYSEFLSRSDTPFDFLSANLLTEAVGDEYNPIPEYDSESLVSNSWNIFGHSGRISQSSGDNYINNLTITANAMLEEAIAFNSLQIIGGEDDSNPSVDRVFSQFNYQIAFNLIAYVSQESSLASAYNGLMIDDKIMDNLFDEWKSGFVLSTNANVQGQPVYTKDNDSFLIGRTDNIFDRIVPFVGSYEYDSSNPSLGRFQIDITDQSNNLKDFTFGLMFEKTVFSATNIVSSFDFEATNPSEVEAEIHTIYTGMAKFVVLIKTEDVDSDRANYIIVREFPEKINVTNENNYTIIVNYTALDSDEVTTLVDTYDRTYLDRFLGQITLLIDNIPRFSQSFISTISDDYNYFDIGLGIPYGGYYIADKMSPSKMGVFDDAESTLVFSNISITSPTFAPNADIISLSDRVRDMTSLRVWSINEPRDPGGGAVVVITDDLLYLEGVDIIKYTLYIQNTTGIDYDQIFDVTDFDKISINFDVYDTADRIIVRDGNETILYDSGFYDPRPFSLGNTYFDVDVTSLGIIRITVLLGPHPNNTSYEFTANFKITYGFAQVPITFEGINQSPNITLGMCNDVHVAWQSNRDKYWNIFYSNTVNKLSPFRFNTQITDTESNSLRPSVSVSRNGSRLITWHDDRNGNYDIFTARTTEGYVCDQDKCSKKMAGAFESEVVECSISLLYRYIAGIYSLSLGFYTDAALNDLYKTITLDDDSVTRWLINNSSVNSFLSYDDMGLIEGVTFSNNGVVTVSYAPDKNDGIFDMVLYVKLTATEVT